MNNGIITPEKDMKNNTLATLIVSALVLASSGAAFAQGARNVKITTVKVTDQIYMLVGQGGNIGLCIGEDGTFMIDDQYAPLTGKILAAIGEITDQKVTFLVNTHLHGDHVGGNANLASTGTTIVAHDNVRARLKESQSIDADGLPVITFNDEMTFHWNGETIHVSHVAHAHTDGDVIIHFRESNVIHTGDIFFNGMYPRFDVDLDGSIDGMIAACDVVIKMSDEKTKIMPGHGPLSNVKELRAYRKMLKSVRNKVAKMVDQHMERSDVIAAKPTESYDEEWGGGYFKPEVFVGWVYDSLVARND